MDRGMLCNWIGDRMVLAIPPFNYSLSELAYKLKVSPVDKVLLFVVDH